MMPNPALVGTPPDGPGQLIHQASLTYSLLTLITKGHSPIRHPGTRWVGDGRPTTELEVAYSQLTWVLL